MTDFKISPRVYTKIILHAAKYPHRALNGILLADKETAGNSKNVNIVDVIPLFHQCLYVTPMAEIALMQIDVLCDDKELVIAGYYAAPENFDHNTLDKVPAIKIAEKIAEHCPNTCLLVVDNKFVCLDQVKPALIAWRNVDSRWTKAEFQLEDCTSTLEAVSALLKKGAQKDIVDFDNYLDNIDNDWTNEFLNKDLDKLMAMY